jgi:hypothetical protein
MTRLRLVFFWPKQPLQPLEIVLHGRRIMPVAGPLGLTATYLTSRTPRVMIVVLYIVLESIASSVTFQCVVAVGPLVTTIKGGSRFIVTF